MNSREHTAAAIGYLDQYVRAGDEKERERLRLMADMHNLLARRPEYSNMLPPLIRHPRAALLIANIK